MNGSHDMRLFRIRPSRDFVSAARVSVNAVFLYAFQRRLCPVINIRHLTRAPAMLCFVFLLSFANIEFV